MARIRLKSTSMLRRLAAESTAVSRKKRQSTASKRPLIFTDKPAEWRECSDGAVELVLPIRLTNGNDGQKKHHGPTIRFRKDCGAWCKVWFPGRKPFATAVKLVVTRILARGERLWDADSIGRGNSKQIVDSLVGCGIFHDDKPQWIASVDYRQDANQRLDYPRVSIRISPVPAQPSEQGIQ